MNDIEAMRRYLEALAANQRMALFTAPGPLSSFVSHPQQQQLQQGPWVPPASLDMMNQPIPTKLNNLRLDQSPTLVPSLRTTASGKAEPAQKPMVYPSGDYYSDSDDDDDDDDDDREKDNDESSDEDFNKDNDSPSTSTQGDHSCKKIMPGSTSTAATKSTTAAAVVKVKTTTGLVLPTKSKKNSIVCSSSSLVGGGLSRFGTSELISQGPIPTRLVHFYDLESDKALLQMPVDKTSRLDREERSNRMMARLLESGVLTTRETTPGQLPMTFQPGPLDVIISSTPTGGRHQQQTDFQQLIFCAVPTYQVAIECHCPQDVKRLVQTIVQAVSKQGRFVAPIPNCNKTSSIPPLWCEVSRNIAERFCLHELKMASHAMAKVQQSMIQAGGVAAHAPSGSTHGLTASGITSTTSRGGLKISPPAPLPSSPKIPKASSAVAPMEARSHVQIKTARAPSSAMSTSSSTFARRITPPDISPPQLAELWEGCASGKTSPSALDLLSEAAFHVDSMSKRKKAKSSSAGGKVDDNDGEPNHKQRRISVDA